MENENSQSRLPFQLYDREADVLIVQRRLPHWSQPGAVCFITFRTSDSLPKTVLDNWFHDRAQWLTLHGIDPDAANWRQQLKELDPSLARTFLDTSSGIVGTTRRMPALVNAFFAARILLESSPTASIILTAIDTC